MADCRYCDQSFDTEAAELAHLEAEHRDELGPIDRRRIGDVGDDDGGISVVWISAGVVLLSIVGIVGFVVFFGLNGGAAADEPHGVGSVHTHGTMEVTIDGVTLDLEEPAFRENDQAFHFHAGYHDRYGAQIYHLHAQGVTLQYALGTLGIEVNDAGTELTFDGERYDDGAPDTEIRIEANGEPVAPGEHVLSGVPSEAEAAQGAGDDVVVVVTTDG